MPFLFLKIVLAIYLQKNGTKGIKNGLFGADNSAGRFCAVCSENGGVSETTKAGVFLFEIDLVELLWILGTFDV